MPNWCYNTLYMEGNHSDLEKLKSINMDFNKIIPMPAELFADIDGDNAPNIGGSNPKEGTPEAAIKAGWVEKYGHDGWYSWSNANWGTKWNASKVEWEHDGESYTVKFNTAWGEPEEIIQALAKQFPDVYFDHSWQNEGDIPSRQYKDGEEE